MSWTSSRIEMPEDWWDALRLKNDLPQWFRELTRWIASKGYTHMHTQTFRSTLTAFEARARYLRFLAERSLPWMVTDVLFAVELHPGGHGAHIHALWKTRFDILQASSNGPQLYRFVKEQGNISMGFSRLWPIADQSAQPGAYCLKYILKGLKALESDVMPGPSDPQEQEKIWGIWNPPPRNGAA